MQKYEMKERELEVSLHDATLIASSCMNISLILNHLQEFSKTANIISTCNKRSIATMITKKNPAHSNLINFAKEEDQTLLHHFYTKELHEFTFFFFPFLTFFLGNVAQTRELLVTTRGTFQLYHRLYPQWEPYQKNHMSMNICPNRTFFWWVDRQYTGIY